MRTNATAIVPLVLDCYLRFAEGYGYAAIRLALALDALPNVDLYVPARSEHIHQELPARLQRVLHKAASDLYYYPTVVFRTPPPRRTEPWPTNLAWYTSWESTEIPREWPDLLNEHATMMLVPSNRQVEIMRSGGIDIPVLVVPHGVNEEEYHLVQRPERDIFVFGFYASRLDHRKGVDLLLKAFLTEFPRQAYPDVRLHLKGRGTFNWPITSHSPPDDPRICIVSKVTSVTENLEFLQQLDCFVFPTRGEGFGLPPLEAMASGLPVIVTNWNGPEDYLDAQHSFPLDYRMVEVNMPSRNANYSYTGYWAEPDVDHLQGLMRNCYEHRAHAKAKGIRAAKHVSENWTWGLAATKLVSLLTSFFLETDS